MSHSSHRLHDPDSVHHITSRIAHRVYLLEAGERNDLLAIIRKAAEFSGVNLIGWCIMTNHFHLLVHLPPKAELGEEEILRRYAVLKGDGAAKTMAETLAMWRATGETGEHLAEEWLERQRRRMYDVGEFMKIVKQWFTQDYNNRTSHKGTLWESAYHDRAVKFAVSDMARCLAYIHLNPVRAAQSDTFDGYAWSSYAAFKRGDSLARAGMRFVYGDNVPYDEIASMHEALLSDVLEFEKLQRAEEIARRRAIGYETPSDPLTDDALVQQAAAHIEEVKKASIRLQEERDNATSRRERNAALESGVLAALRVLSTTDAASVAKSIGVSTRTAYRLLKTMAEKRLVEQEGYGGGWKILSK